MPLAVTSTADLSFAAAAFAVLAASIGPAGGIQKNMRGLDPLAAAFAGAVNTVFGGVLLIFFIPFLLELDVK